MKKEITFESLRKFNGFMGVLHLIQGALMLWFAISIDKIANFLIPIRSYFLTFDTTQMRLVTDTKVLFDFPFGIIVSMFLFLSALAHFIIISPWGNKIYNRDLAKGMNRFRWYEYALSSSLMIVLIALLFGVYDIGSLILIFGINATMNLFGLVMEEINQYRDKTDWKPFIFGSIAGIVPWVVIILYAFGNSNPSEVPWFVYVLTGSYFVFFNLFPINMILQYKKIGKWKNYLYGEKGYIVLSLVAKSVLAWIAFAGVMQP
ncbi:MAG: heliorhodopsin HeR [Tissierellia bacterium]|nr:heliorhodopsin HeR [Tissierellia bacterium]